MKCNSKNTVFKLIPITNRGYNGDHTFRNRKTLHMLCKEIVKDRKIKKNKYHNIIGNRYVTSLSDAEEIKSNNERKALMLK